MPRLQMDVAWCPEERIDALERFRASPRRSLPPAVQTLALHLFLSAVEGTGPAD